MKLKNNHVQQFDLQGLNTRSSLLLTSPMIQIAIPQNGVAIGSFKRMSKLGCGEYRFFFVLPCNRNKVSGYKTGYEGRKRKIQNKENH